MCEHSWIQVNEEFLLGGYFPVGYRCEKCDEFVSQNKLTPAGLGGTITKKHELVGPHGGHGNRADGKLYKKQIYNSETGELTIVE
jgi:hypothetical protein